MTIFALIVGLVVSLVCTFFLLKSHFATPTLTYIVTVCENNSDGLFVYSWPCLEEPTINSIQDYLVKEATQEMEENLDIDEFYLKIKNIQLLPYHHDFCVNTYTLDSSRVLQVMRSTI